jgi:DNA-directed RNA polymerase specialized sigma subunit
LLRQQQNEIVNLRTQLSQANQLQSPTSSYSSPQQRQKTTKSIATKKKISVEEYRRISNQSDYLYVEAYYRKDGTPVRAHYRRRPSK